MPFPSTRPAHILEDLASGRSLAVIAQQAGCNVSEVFLMAKQVPELKSRLDQFVTDQAIAIGAAIAFFSPNTVVLGGGVVEMEGYPQEALLYELRARFSPQRFINPDIKWAALGWRSALHGARVAVQSRLRALPTEGPATV
jgi:allose kinase